MMAGESAFIASLRALATSGAARGLLDDAAVLPFGDYQLVITSDTLVEGVHFLPDDPADSIGWKLAAVNLSDLAAKGATPVGCLMNYALSGDADWDAAFLAGLDAALSHYEMPLIGGDTVSMPVGSARSFTLTALGSVPLNQAVPSRSGARAGDILCVTGVIGDAALGLSMRQSRSFEVTSLQAAYMRPQPHLRLGIEIAPMVRAMMDISDGLLIDAQRMAEASGCAMRIDLDAVPLSLEYLNARPDSLESRLQAATGGDDYQLLFALAPYDLAAVIEMGLRRNTPVSVIGTCLPASGIALFNHGESLPLPARLGYQHGVN